VKRDSWEGGHRVPFIVRWPARIKAGVTSDQLLCLTDVMATVAAITGAELPRESAEDSFNMLPVLDGKATAPVRPHMIVQGFAGARTLSVRKGNWKYLAHTGSGGNKYNTPELKKFDLPEAEPDAPGQLYDLSKDPGETTNLYSKHPELVEEMKALLKLSETTHRTRP
jgi:arylsulfatase A